MSSWKRKKKQIKYYRIDDNDNLVEISKEDEIFSFYESVGIYRLLKLEILPVDINIAPLKRLPDYYARQKLLLREQWEQDRLRIERIIAEAKEKKRTNQPFLIRFQSASQRYPAEYDKKNDPRNRVNLSKGIYNKRKRGKRPPPLNQTMV